jgi:hypothetical protein
MALRSIRATLVQPMRHLSIEGVGHDFCDLSSGHIDQEQIGPVANPLESRFRRRQSERGIVGIIIGRREEERRQHRADGPAPVGPAVGIDEGLGMKGVEGVAAKHEAAGRASGMGPTGRSPGMGASDFRRPAARMMLFVTLRRGESRRECDDQGDNNAT